MEARSFAAVAAHGSPKPGFVRGHDNLRLRCDTYLATEARAGAGAASAASMNASAKPGAAPTTNHGPSVYFAHGLGQTRHAWSATAAALASQGHHCVAVDSRGHGESGWDADQRYELDQFIGDVLALARQESRPPIWVGASMGGLLGILAQGEARQDLFAALILVDITPKWEPAGVERILAFMRAYPGGFSSVAEAQHAVASYLPHRASGKSPERLRKLLVTMPGGRLRWHWDPRLLETVAQDAPRWTDRLHAAASRLRLPVLLVSGGRSDVVSDRTIAEFLELVPHAEYRRIADATHMVAGDANDRFTSVISEYLQR